MITKKDMTSNMSTEDIKIKEKIGDLYDPETKSFSNSEELKKHEVEIQDVDDIDQIDKEDVFDEGGCTGIPLGDLSLELCAKVTHTAGDMIPERIEVSAKILTFEESVTITREHYRRTFDIDLAAVKANLEIKYDFDSHKLVLSGYLAYYSPLKGWRTYTFDDVVVTDLS